MGLERARCVAGLGARGTRAHVVDESPKDEKGVRRVGELLCERVEVEARGSGGFCLVRAPPVLAGGRDVRLGAHERGEEPAEPAVALAPLVLAHGTSSLALFSSLTYSPLSRVACRR